MTATLEDIAARRLAGQPLTAAEAATLAATDDIVTLGMIADDIRRGRHGRATTYVRVVEVALPLAGGERISIPRAAGEVRLVGSFPGLDAATAAVRDAAAVAGRVPVSAFSLADLERAAGNVATLTSWLVALREAGLDAVADATLDGLADAGSALAAVSAAGLPVPRLRVDTPPIEGPLVTIGRVQSLLDAGVRVRVLAPLPRHPTREPTTGYADVKTVALTRILLDVPHIQVDWAVHGPKLAQVALTFGADDIDTVSTLEDVAEGRRRAPLEEIRRNIRAASLEPVERDGRFGIAG